MIISLIAAMAENRVIGRRGAIPWNIPSDRRRFRALTAGHTVIFGRKTFETIGRPLHGRKIIVLSRRNEYRAENAVVAHSIGEALDACRGEEEVFIGGGGEVFRETISLARRIYLTVIHRSYEGDTFFPDVPVTFTEDRREEIRDDPFYSVILYERKS